MDLVEGIRIHHKMSAVRLAVPRAGFQFHSQQLLLRQRTSQLTQQQQHLQSAWLQLRRATTSAPPPPKAPPKPRVLEQPDRFRPPSHPQRIRPKPRYAGPPLAEHERQAQKKRQYPHMMPPEGTFMHWFLTDRTVHVFITMVSRSRRSAYAYTLQNHQTKPTTHRASSSPSSSASTSKTSSSPLPTGTSSRPTASFSRTP